MTQHTDGPWNVGPVSEMKLDGFKVYRFPISAGGLAIAAVFAGSVGKGDFMLAQGFANARLIGAAPAMLKALEAAVTERGPLGDDTRPAWWQAACAAIAAAKVTP